MNAYCEKIVSINIINKYFIPIVTLIVPLTKFKIKLPQNILI